MTSRQMDLQTLGLALFIIGVLILFAPAIH